MYPEYHAICTAMASADGRPTSLFGGTYTPRQATELVALHSDGRCELSTGGGGDSVSSATASVTVDAVAVLVGSEPDLTFLPPALLNALDAAGPPSQVSADGVKSTHPTYVDVDPYSMQVRSVPGLYALGPLRGDNFARFAIHDGHGVAASVADTAPPRRVPVDAVGGTLDLSADGV